MSSRPVGPREFNSVLGVAAVGVAVTAKVASGVIDAIEDHRFIKNKLVPRCQKVLDLSQQSRDRMLSMADTFVDPDLQNARQRLIEAANKMHGKFIANFEPEEFSAAVQEARAMGERPESLMHRWCSEITAGPLWCVDKIQSVRMSGRERRQQWQELEHLKQEIVNLWGKEYFDISRSEGRERNYVLWQALAVLMKFGAAIALCFGALVLVLSLP